MLQRVAGVMTLLALSSPVFGQIDPRTEPFLDFTDPARLPVTPTRTVDYTLCSIFYHGEPESEAEGELCVRTVMDFVNRRMLSQATSRRDDALSFEMVYADGQAAMTDDMTGEPTALPQEQVAFLERSLDYAADVVETGGALPDELLSATYNGVVAYGDVVSGEQITARVMARSFMLGNTSPQETTIRFVFSKDKLFAFVSEVPPKELLHVLENPDDPVPMRRFISGKTYWLENGRPKLFSAQRLTRYRVNRPLGEALFRLDGRCFVARTPHPTDRRSALVHYRPQEQRVVGRLYAVLRHLNANAEALGERDKGAVIAFLTTMTGGLTEAATAPQG